MSQSMAEMSNNCLSVWDTQYTRIDGRHTLSPTDFKFEGSMHHPMNFGQFHCKFIEIQTLFTFTQLRSSNSVRQPDIVCCEINKFDIMSEVELDYFFSKKTQDSKIAKMYFVFEPIQWWWYNVNLNCTLGSLKQKWK